MRFNPLRHRRLRRTLVAAATLTLGAGMVIVAANQANAATGCSVAYSANSWNNGFTANIIITNLGDPLTTWNLQWNFAGNQAITSSWNSTYTQSAQHVTMNNAAWNGSLATNATVNPGFQATYSGTNANPTSFSLNGVTCTGSVGGSPSTSPTGSSPSASTSPSQSASASPSATTSPPPAGTHVDNPYVGAKFYNNPDWAAKAAAEPGGSRVSGLSTAVWIDRIAAIAGTTDARGVRAHLDTALTQAAGQPLTIQFVIYDLPGRDCAALASNGELGPTEIGRYETQYIDPIAAILGDPKYSSLRISTIIEIDSLPNLITNAGGTAGSTDACAVMKANGNYVTGIQYALNKLHAIPNVYTYIDAAHHGWLGWDTNFGPAADLFTSVARGTTAGLASVDGFITDTANYSALTEPYFNIGSTVNGTTVRQSTWVDWNQYVDELTYTQAFRQRLISNGFASTLGMLIDTSRNGWGGSARPTAASTSTDLNTFVNQSRVDKRIHAGNWCNQSGAGLGERPRANPAAGIDAYVWVKPPGESDGASSAIPNNEGKGFDQMCDPAYTGNARNGNSLTGALPNAPLSGHWFSAQFQQLMANAFPPLS